MFIKWTTIVASMVAVAAFAVAPFVEGVDSPWCGWRVAEPLPPYTVAGPADAAVGMPAPNASLDRRCLQDLDRPVLLAFVDADDAGQFEVARTADRIVYSVDVLVVSDDPDVSGRKLVGDAGELRASFGAPAGPFWVAVRSDGTVLGRFAGPLDEEQLVANLEVVAELEAADA